MSYEQDKYDEKEQIDYSENTITESYTKKFIRSGLLAVGASVIGKKLGIKDNALLKYTGVAAASMVLSEDKNKGGDLAVAGALLGFSEGIGLTRTMVHSDINLYKKIYEKLNKADTVMNNFNIGMFTLKDTLVKNVKINASKSESGFSNEMLNGFSKSFQGTIKTIGDGIYSLFKDGISKSIEKLSDNDVYAIYNNYYRNYNLTDLELKTSDLMKEIGVEIKEKKVGFITGFIDDSLSSLFKNSEDLSLVSEANIYEARETIKKMKKIQTIEHNTFFTDMIGMYSRYDKDTNQIVARYDKLFSDNSNFFKGLNELANDFKSSYKGKWKEYEKLDAKGKEEAFVNYIKDNGLSELLEKAYKRDDLISFKEVNELVEGISINDIQNKDMKHFFQSATKSQMKMFEKRSYFNDMNQVVEEIKGMKNIDLLQNFAFTNILTKTNYGFQDATALDNSIMLLQGMGAVERNILSVFRTPFESINRLWNPLNIMDSKNRIKDKVTNEIMGFGYNKNGFLLNGLRITQEKTEEGTKYATDGMRNKLISYRKNILDVVTEDISVLKKNERKETTIKEIIKTYKKEGAKKAFSDFSYSLYNPFSFRYDETSGLRRVKAVDGYFKDDKNIFSMFDKKNIDNKFILNKTANTKFSTFANMIFGDHADVEISRLRKENEAYEKTIEKISQLFTDSMINFKFQSGDTKGMVKEISQTAQLYSNNLGEESLKYNSATILNFFKNEPDLSNVKKAYIETVEALRLENPELINPFNRLYTEYEKALLIDSSVNKYGFTPNIYNSIKDTDFFRFYSKTKFGQKNSEINKTFFKLKAMNSDDSFVKDMNPLFEMLTEFRKALDLSEADFDSVIFSKSGIYNDTIRSFNNEIDIKDPSNPLNNLYELIRGKRFNDHYKKIFSNNPKLEKSVITIDKMSGTASSKVLYSKTVTRKAIEDIIGEFSKDSDKFQRTSYNIYDQLEESLRQSGSFEKKKSYNYSFQQLVEFKNELLYTKNNNITSSVILEETFKASANVRHILDKVRESIINLINPKPFDLPLPSGVKFRSKNFNSVDTTLNTGMKSIVTNFQNALEFVGIERIPNSQLGERWNQQLLNFMKYRVAPITAAYMTYRAVDSVSDTFIPDEVPIIGNGVSGVAAKGIATSRIGLQYLLKGTGALSLMRMVDNALPGVIDNGLTSWFDPLMDPSEMIETYFKGKPIRVNENRFWFTAGRQSAEGEEFGQYRPHALYTMQNKDAGIYSNKFEKLFRKDILLTKYPWYLFDPYKEEREAYEKYGALYPKTEQLFLDIPVIGHFMNSTIGEVIKPTRYIAEEQWRVGKTDMMFNPNYDEHNPASPKYIKFVEPNKIVKSTFEAVNDLATWSGLPGYAFKLATESVFNKTNPYEDQVTLKSIDTDINYYSEYENLQLGGLFGITEPIRRLLDKGNTLGTIDINPVRQNLPEWMPEFFQRGNNPYMALAKGNYILPSKEFDKINEDLSNPDLSKFRSLSMLAPYSKEFDMLKNSLLNTDMNNKERQHFYESIGYSEAYGKAEYGSSRGITDKTAVTEGINLTIDKKISPYEFLSNGKRYKFDTVTANYNELDKVYGNSKAKRLMSDLDKKFKEGETYNFKISTDAAISGGIDRDGDFFKIDHDSIDNDLNLNDSFYRNSTLSKRLGRLALLHQRKRNSAMPMEYEKKYGQEKDVVTEWTSESVQSPFFRDWDNPLSSFVIPFYTFSANNPLSSMAFSSVANDMYLRSNATFNVLGNLTKAGMFKLPFNLISGRPSVSGQYEDETLVGDELEKIKLLAGDKSYFNMTGQENLKQFENMLNEEDSKYFEELANVQSKKSRETILKYSNSRMENILKTIWNRQQESLDGTIPYEVQKEKIDNVVDIGAYTGNEELTKILLKQKLNIGLSKLDNKRYGVISSYKGNISKNQAQFISDRMYQRYNAQSHTASTIGAYGTINLNKQEGWY